MEELVRRAARHPVSVLMVVLAVLVFGVVAFFGLERELLPSLAVPVARVVCEYPGIPAAEIEDLVTVPLENALSSVRGVREITSLSKEALAAVALRFDWKADMRTAAVDIRQRIDALYPLLPFGAAKPVVFLEDANDQPVLTLAAALNPTVSLTEATGLIRGELATALRQTPGVAAVQVVGLAEPEVRIEVDEQKISVAGLTLRGLAAGVAGSLCDQPVGIVREGERERLLKASSGVRSLEDLGALPVIAGSRPAGLRLADFATVRITPREQTSYFHLDGDPCVGLLLYKSPDAGSLNVVRQIRRRLGPLQAKFAREVRITEVADASREIRAVTRDLLTAMALGVLATFGVLQLLFRRLRPALIVAASVPVSMVAVCLVMGLARVSLNVISLAGMAAGVGMIVDGGIVVLDRLLQRRAESPAQIAEATASVAGALGGSTATTVLVFLPVLFIPGVTGALFRELVLTICFLLGAALLAALVLTPALYSLLGRSLAQSPGQAGPPGRSLRRFLVLAMRRPLLPVALTGVVLAGGIAALATMRWELLPPVERGLLEAKVRFPAGTPVAQAERGSQEIAGLLRAIPGVSRVFASAGYDQLSLAERSLSEAGPLAVHYRMQVEGHGTAAVSRVGATVTETLRAVPGIRHSVRLPQDSVARLLGDDTAAGLRLEGEDRTLLLARAKELTDELERVMRTPHGVETDTRPEGWQTTLRLDSQMLKHHELAAAEVLAALQLAVRGQTVGTLPVGGSRLDVRVSLQPGSAATPQQLFRLQVPSNAGPVAVGLLGSLDRGAVYPELRRRDRRPCVTLRAEGPGARQAFAERLDPGASLLGVSALHEARREIAVVFALALLLIYLLLAAQFESLLVPFSILLCLPLSISGSLLLLRACGYTINLSSLLGMLILTGTAVNGPILLASASSSRSRGAVIAAAGGHLRPVSAATVTTMAALLPVAVLTRGGSALQSHMAVALIGGLAGSAAAALLVFPLLHRRRRR